MFNKIAILVCLGVLCGCNLNNELDIRPNSLISPKTKFLKEYWEDNIQLHYFNYENGRISFQSEIEQNGQATINYHYDEAGRPSIFNVRRQYFDHDLHFIYKDSLFTEFEVWNSLGLVQKYFFTRDNEGKIVQMARVSLNHGLLYYLNFYWEEENIAKYEYTFYSEEGPQTIIYEFSYDEYKNPYTTIFRDVGFNFLSYLPLTENNVSEVKVYSKDNSSNFIMYKNTYAYSANYPFVRLATKYEGKNRSEIYSEYKY